jgi:hypothetical protein
MALRIIGYGQKNIVDQSGCPELDGDRDQNISAEAV